MKATQIRTLKRAQPSPDLRLYPPHHAKTEGRATFSDKCTCRIPTPAPFPIHGFIQSQKTKREAARKLVLWKALPPVSNGQCGIPGGEKER
jgi:hypothetical protein